MKVEFQTLALSVNPNAVDHAILGLAQRGPGEAFLVFESRDGRKAIVTLNALEAVALGTQLIGIGAFADGNPPPVIELQSAPRPSGLVV